MTLVDLSHDIYHHMPRISILPEVEVSCLFRIAEGRPLNIAQLLIATHAGTHIDAPYHAFEHGRTIDQFPPDTFWGPAVVIPVQRAAGEPAVVEEEPLTAKESALAWLRFAGELVVALAVGIGLYFAFTVLWELVPYVALVAAPVAVTGLVAGVAAWRRRQGEGELGMRLHLVLLLAGTVLVIAPAARLLAG